MAQIDLRHGDSREVLKTLPDNSVDSVVTDPPYALVSIVKRFGSANAAPAKGDIYKRASAGFMGKTWDTGETAFDPEFWVEVMRVLKPGGHLLAFSGTRSVHRLVCAIEDAGFEIRDMIAWLYGSGFPKSHNLKDEWQGWGTALKPALEPITVARKPLIGTVAENVLAHGTGALNIDESRVGSEGREFLSRGIKPGSHNIVGSGWDGNNGLKFVSGRWPANLIHDGSEEVLAGFPGEDEGSAARFFYCAKASKRDRDEGLDGFTLHAPDHGKGNTAGGLQVSNSKLPRANIHPTVKPTDLMRYLCRLVTPPGGTVLDPFMGSGSTGKAAILEGFNFIGIEREEEYINIARARIEAADQPKSQPAPKDDTQTDLFSV